MNLRNYTDVINLLRKIALQDGEVRQFFVGEDKRLLDASRSNIKYPYVWVEYADGVLSDNGSGALTGMYDVRLYVIGSATLNDPHKEEALLQTCEDILKRLLLRLRKLGATGKIKFLMNKTRFMRIKVAQLDDNWGWECSLQLGDYRQELCVNEAEQFDVSILSVQCPDPVSSGNLSMDIDAESFSVAWDGDCTGDSLIVALNQLVMAINANTDSIASAESFGKQIIVRAKTVDTDLNLTLTGGDFTWNEELQTIFE